MGLDQWAIGRKDGSDILITEWRKHANLQGWMSDLYMNRGGTSDFNQVELRLYKKDLERLSDEYDKLKEAKGFFWGVSSDIDNEKTNEFIKKAFIMIEEGYKIIYSSWY